MLRLLHPSPTHLVGIALRKIIPSSSSLAGPMIAFQGTIVSWVPERVAVCLQPHWAVGAHGENCRLRQAVMLSFVECFQLQVPVTGHCPQPSRRKSSINNLYILLLHVLFITANNFAVGWTMCCVLSDTHLRERHGLSRWEGFCSQTVRPRTDPIPLCVSIFSSVQ